MKESSRHFRIIDMFSIIISLIAITISLFSMHNLSEQLKYNEFERLFNDAISVISTDEQLEKVNLNNGRYLILTGSNLSGENFSVAYVDNGDRTDLGFNQENFFIHVDSNYNNEASFNVSDDYNYEQNFQWNLDNNTLGIDIYISSDEFMWQPNKYKLPN